MLFGVIYTIEWDPAENSECPPLEGDEADMLHELFDVTGTETCGENGAYTRTHFASKDLLSREDFEHFLRYTRLQSSPTPTMGALIAWRWGLGFSSPAVAFESPDSLFVESAYVIPLPEVEPRELECAQDVELRAQRAWERVRTAVINTYKEGIS